MMYSEFVAGTGCKDNAKNYEVFKNLEVMYMNTDMTKAEIYEYGKKLVDNSKSEEELRFEAEIKAEIEDLKAQIESDKRQVAYYETMLESWKADGEKTMVAHCRNMIRYHKDEVKKAKSHIATLKHFFNV